MNEKFPTHGCTQQLCHVNDTLDLRNANKPAADFNEAVVSLHQHQNGPVADSAVMTLDVTVGSCTPIQRKDLEIACYLYRRQYSENWERNQVWKSMSDHGETVFSKVKMCIDRD
mgnify:CR=1 FL=1